MIHSFFHPSAFTLFPWKADRACGEEHRLLHKTASHEAAPEGEKKEKPKEGKDKKEGGDTVEKEAKKTNDQVKKAVPQVGPEPAPSPEPIPEGPHYAQLPSIREGIKHTRNAILMGLGIALPPLGIAGLAAGGTLRYAASKFTSQPLSMKQAAAGTLHAPAVGLKSIEKSVFFLPHLLGAAGLNTLKWSGNKLNRILHKTILEPWHEVSGLIAGKITEGKDKGFHPITGLVKIGGGVLNGVVKVGKGYLGLWKNHWKGMLIAHAFGPAIYKAVSVPKLIGGIGNFGSAVIKILEGLAK